MLGENVCGGELYGPVILTRIEWENESDDKSSDDESSADEEAKVQKKRKAGSA